MVRTCHISFHHAVPTPSVTVTVQPSGPLYAGTTSVTLTCTITLSVDVDTDVMMEVTWFRLGTPLSNTISRVSISPLAESGRTFTSNLTLSPLYPEDNTNFTCEAIGHPRPTQQFINASELGMESDSINVVLRGMWYENG